MVGKFSNLCIKYSGLGFKEKAALYEPLECIANENGHFILNWRVASLDSDTFSVHYDGLQQQGKFRRVKGLQYRTQKGQGTSLLFYKLKNA